jgi:RHS repeat-associated protein
MLPIAVASTNYDAGNRLTQWGGTSPTYDLNGNLTNDGTTGYTWDARNRLTALTGIASFAYDGTDRRQSVTQATTTVATVYDGYDPVQEQSGGSILANLLIGLGVDERFSRNEGSATSTFLTDLLSSTMALTDSSGAVSTTYGYDPYGTTTTAGSAADNPYQFTGRQNDGAGLYYYRARYYRPDWSRFISEDPIGLAAGTNVYVYADQSPAMKRDPMGLEAVRQVCDIIAVCILQPNLTQPVKKFGFTACSYACFGGNPTSIDVDFGRPCPGVIRSPFGGG